MKFILIDKVLSFQAGAELTATKSVSLSEGYLGDHFPIFPVLPGVLLLEGLIESASWLVRESENFEHAIRLAISTGGDSDTIACMAGGIAEGYYGISESIKKEVMNKLDDKLKNVVNQFMEETKC